MDSGFCCYLSPYEYRYINTYMLMLWLCQLNLPLELFNLKRQQQRLVQDDLQLDVVQHTRTAARVRYICTGGCWVKAKEEVFIENIRQMSSLLLGEHSIHTFLHIILLQFIRFFISSWCNLSFSSYLTGSK